LTYVAVGLVGADALSGSLARDPGETVTGSPYAILQGTVTDANNTNYAISYTAANLSITPKAITVTADAKTKVYGSADPALTYAAVGLVGADLLSGSLARDPGETVGGSPYAILQGTVTNTNNTNYSITYTGANFAITPKPITVTADAKTKVYGDADPALTYVAVGLVGADALSGLLARDPGETVAGSPYAILQGSVTDANNTNYAISYTAANLNITPKAVTVTADAKTKVYGDADPTLTYVAVGLVGADALSGSLARDPGETVAGSPYAILQGTVTDANNTNYTISYTGANLNITPKAITVTADAKTKVYGSADPALTYVAVGLVGSDLLSGALARDPGETVAGSPYTILQGTVTNANNTNYSITYTGANLSITTKSITVTADAKTKVYGSADPALTYVAVGLVGSDLLSGALARNPGETVAGSPYAILQGTVTNANNTNYSITYTGANLSITTKPITVTADAKTKVYGSADPVLTYVAAGLVGSDVLAGALTRNPGETVAGSPYAILQGTVTNANNTNYSITYTGANLSITTKSITVTADAKTKVYGSADPALTYVAAGLVGSDVLAGALARNPGETVAGSPYAILQGTVTNANNTNYSITYTSANLTITPKAITVTAAAKTKIYGTADPALTYVAAGLVGSDVLTGALTRNPGETVTGSPYAILQGPVTTTNHTNYNITYTGANLTITTAGVASAVSVTPTSQQYSDSVTLCLTITGGAPLISGGPQAAQSVTFKIGTQIVATNVALIVSGSNLKATYTGALLEPTPFGTAPTGQMAPGSRTVTAVINSPDSNYTINNLQPTAPVTITAENASVVYSGLSYFSTCSSSSCAANVTLSATLTDAADGNRGDIRNARVTFHNGSISGPILGSSNLQPVLVNSSDKTVGTVSVSFVYTLSSSDCADKGATFLVYAVVDNYYTGNNNSDPGTITVSVPGNDAVTGGGHLVMSNSIGTYAGTAGAKTNFGFTMKYNKNGSNAKGQCNIIIRSNNKVYQVKSTAINSLSTSGQYGTFSTKANLTDVTNPLSPVSLGGNLDLLVDMYDYSTGGQNDEVSFSLKSGSTILYLSYWNGTQNIRRVLDGGNISVRTGLSVKMAEAPIVAVSPLLVKVSPNPSATQFELLLNEGMSDKVTVRVYNMIGKMAMVQDYDAGQEIIFGERLPAGAYFVEVNRGGETKTVRVIKQ
jgi:cystathionine beta-lyase family protein involved in aluminum resistance